MSGSHTNNHLVSPFLILFPSLAGLQLPSFLTTGGHRFGGRLMPSEPVAERDGTEFAEKGNDKLAGTLNMNTPHYNILLEGHTCLT